MHGGECWVMKTNINRTIATMKTWILRANLVVSRLDHIRNEEIIKELNLPLIVEVMYSGRLRWFGNV